MNLVSKQPRFTKGGEISFRTGSYDLYKPSVDLYGPLSASIAYRLNSTYESANSFRDGVSSKRFYVAPSLLLKIAGKTTLSLDVDYLYHNFTPDFGIGSLNNVKIPDVPRSRFMGSPWQYNIAKQTTATASLIHRFSDAWRITSSLSFQNFNRDYYSTERIQASADGDWIRPLGKIWTDEIYYGGQANINGKIKAASIEHNLLIGVDADRTTTVNKDFSFPIVTGLPAGSYDKINILDPGKYQQRTDIPLATNIRKRTAPVDRFGVYAQDLLKISPKFNVLAGIRWSYVATFGIDSANLLTGANTKGSTRYDQSFSPRLGIVYKPSLTTSVFASYSNSFVTNTGQDIHGKAVKPSLIDQYEAGVKNEFFNGLLSANFTLYRIVNNNLAQTAPYLLDGTANNNSSIKALTGQTTSDGVEIDLATQLRNIDVTAGYSYNFMRYTKTDTTAGSFKTGERLVNNPAHTANMSIYYTFSSVVKGLKLGVTAVYIGDRFAGWNTDIVKVNNIAQYRSRIFPVKAFTTIDISTSYTYKKITFIAKVSNLTNTLNYYVHENYSVNPIPPIQFASTVSYKFK